MEKQGPEFYDLPSVFDPYTSLRNKSESPNETIEQPILWEMIGNAANKEALDLGCGDARAALKFRNARAKNYLGVDGSCRMCELAKKNTEPGYSSVVHAWLQDFNPAEKQFDLVISSLALHYTADLEGLATKVEKALRPGGRFIFSVEHPVITSSNKALENSDLRQAWIVDDYFQRGAREVKWMGDTVHRTIEDQLNALIKAGLRIERLRESDPPKAKFAAEALWNRRRRIPLFLFISATKN